MQENTSTERQGTLTDVKHLIEFCGDNGIVSVQLSSAAVRLVETEKELRHLRHVQRVVEQATLSAPELESFPVSWLARAKSLVDESTQAVFESRRAELASQVNVTYVRGLCSLGRTLLEEQSRIGALAKVAGSMSVYELRAMAKTVRSSGTVSRLSSSFREAKRVYLQAFPGSSFTKETAADSFQQLGEWKEASERYIQDAHARSTLGDLFRGLSTDFGLLDEICTFYEMIDATFTLTSQHELRNLLKVGPQRALYSLPDIELSDAPELNALQIAEKLQPLEQQVAIDRVLQSHIEGLQSQLIGSEVRSLRDLEDALGRLERLALVSDKVQSNATAKEFLGPSFLAANTDRNLLQKIDILIKRLIQLSDLSLDLAGEIGHGKGNDLLDSVERVLALESSIAAATGSLDLKSGRKFSHELPSVPLVERSRYLQEAADDRTSLFLHSHLYAAWQQLEETGFSWIARELEDSGKSLQDLMQIVDAVVIRASAIEIYREYGSTLSQYRGEKLNSLRSNIARLDKQILAGSRTTVLATALENSNPPYGNGVGRKADYSEFALLRHEAGKQKRHISVRALTKRAGKALQELKPCWMMSPLAVAQFLPHDLSFDLCIIDEASQMPPEDALGALIRSDQAMVVGDTNQLPPSTFFRRVLDDDVLDEDEGLVTEESILEIANSAFRPARQLRWHYRSQHPSLIQFSNEHIYNGNLVVLPAPSSEESNMGVKFVPVEGAYRGGTNIIEAREVVNRARQFMRRFPDKSLGIVTFNVKQRDLILEEWERAQNDHPHVRKYMDYWSETADGLESFFIKNLENVQGDERDVIFISTVYGPEEIGRPVMQRFGPINGVAGRRRLNVLFTRSKQLIVTFSSMKSSDIRADETSNPGAFMLKQWLEYSATGVLPVGSQTENEPDSAFEIYVINQLRSMGCQPVPQVGVRGYRIDIGVKHPQWPHGYIMGVECDGAAYHSSRSARDRDRYREEILKPYGWHLYRIWSTDWFNNPRAEAERLRIAIQQRLEDLNLHSDGSQVPGFLEDDEQACDTELAQEKVSEEPRNNFQRSPTDSRIDLSEGGSDNASDNPDFGQSTIKEMEDTAYHPSLATIPANDLVQDGADRRKLQTPFQYKLNADRFFDVDYLPTLRSYLCNVIDQDGPITFGYLSEMAARSHGWQRTGSRIKKQVWAAIATSRKHSKCEDDREVFWPESLSPQTVVLYRGRSVNGIVREWANVPHPEKLGLAVAILEKSNRQRAVDIMAARIGFERLRQGTREELEALLTRADEVRNE